MKSPRNSAQQDKVKPGANGVFRHESRKQTRARTGAFEINTESLGGGMKKRLKTFLRPQVRQAFANSESRAGGKESGKMQSDVEMTPMKSGRAR